MSKDFFAFAGFLHRDYKEEAKYPLQEGNASLSERDAYDAILWHDTNGSYLSIKNRECTKKRFEAWITPIQALSLLEFLEGQRERLQELCENNKNKEN